VTAWMIWTLGAPAIRRRKHPLGGLLAIGFLMTRAAPLMLPRFSRVSEGKYVSDDGRWLIQLTAAGDVRIVRSLLHRASGG